MAIIASAAVQRQEEQLLAQYIDSLPISPHKKQLLCANPMLLVP